MKRLTQSASLAVMLLISTMALSQAPADATGIGDQCSTAEDCGGLGFTCERVKIGDNFPRVCVKQPLFAVPEPAPLSLSLIGIIAMGFSFGLSYIVRTFRAGSRRE